MFDILKKYKQSDRFIFSPGDSLSKVCKAPTDKNGVYIAYAIAHGKKELIYIGCSGMKQADGSVKTRKGGMKARLVKGKQFDKARRQSWPQRMLEEGIEKLEVQWWVTYDDELRSYPQDVEDQLLTEFLLSNKRLPRWNKKYPKGYKISSP